MVQARATLLAGDDTVDDTVSVLKCHFTLSLSTFCDCKQNPSNEAVRHSSRFTLQEKQLAEESTFHPFLEVRNRDFVVNYQNDN